MIPANLFEKIIQAKTRDLPDDLSGPVRVVKIGPDSSLCCGTHVNNLAQLQVIKLLHLENSKRWYISVLSTLLMSATERPEPDINVEPTVPKIP